MVCKEDNQHVKEYQYILGSHQTLEKEYQGRVFSLLLSEGKYNTTKVLTSDLLPAGQSK